MGLTNWYEEKTKKLNMWDFAVLKIALIVFGIIIGAYIPAMVKQNVMYLAAVVVILYIILMYRIFSK